MLEEVQRALRISEEHGGLIGAGGDLIGWKPLRLNAEFKTRLQCFLSFMGAITAFIFKDGRVFVNDVDLVGGLAVFGGYSVERDSAARR